MDHVDEFELHLFQGLSGSIPKGYNSPNGPTSQGLHKIPLIH